jgi:hypothetical protein
VAQWGLGGSMLMCWLIGDVVATKRCGGSVGMGLLSEDDVAE